jgi:hypothetical protein
MKKILLILVVILTALSVSACQAHDELADLDNYDYHLLIVVTRQRVSQGNYFYGLREAGTPLTPGNIIMYGSDELWSVGEFVLAIELDEEGNVYYTGLDVTTDMNNESEKLKTHAEMMELYYELKLDYYEELYGFDLDSNPDDFVEFLYDNYRELYDYLMEVDNDNT